MIYEYKKSEQSPIDFDFSGVFIPGDSLAALSSLFAGIWRLRDIGEARPCRGRGAVALRCKLGRGQDRLPCFRKRNLSDRDTYTLEADLIIIPDSSPEHDDS